MVLEHLDRDGLLRRRRLHAKNAHRFFPLRFTAVGASAGLAEASIGAWPAGSGGYFSARPSASRAWASMNFISTTWPARGPALSVTNILVAPAERRAGPGELRPALYSLGFRGRGSRKRQSWRAPGG